MICLLDIRVQSLLCMYFLLTTNVLPTFYIVTVNIHLATHSEARDFHAINFYERIVVFAFNEEL